MPGTFCGGEVFQDDELVGRYDCYEQLDGVVYEFKSKNKRGMRCAPYQEAIGQIKRCLDALDGDAGFLIYVDRASLEVEEYPVSRWRSQVPERVPR